MYVEFKWYKNNLKMKEICNLNVLRILIPEEDQLNTPLTGATTAEWWNASATLLRKFSYFFTPK